MEQTSNNNNTSTSSSSTSSSRSSSPAPTSLWRHHISLSYDSSLHDELSGQHDEWLEFLAHCRQECVVQSIDLASSNFTLSALNALITRLPVAHDLSTFLCDHSSLMPEHHEPQHELEGEGQEEASRTFNHLMHVLSKLPALTELSFEGSTLPLLSSSHLHTLTQHDSHAVPPFKRLQSLNLSNSISLPSFNALCHHLSTCYPHTSSHLPLSLASLTLSNNSFNSTCIPSLRGMLNNSLHCPFNSLTSLDLSCNALILADISSLFHSFGSIQSLIQLRHLNLSSNHMEQPIELDEQQHKDESEEEALKRQNEFHHYFMQHYPMATFHVWQYILHLKHLETLNLNDCSLSYLSVYLMFYYLQSHPTLHTLQLSHNRAGRAYSFLNAAVYSRVSHGELMGEKAVAQPYSAKQRTSIKLFQFLPAHLKTLELECDELGELDMSEMQAFAERMVKHSCALQTLNLNGNQLSSTHLQTLLPSFNTSHLTSLSLSHNSITSIGFSSIYSYLLTNPALTRLDVSHNHLNLNDIMRFNSIFNNKYNYHSTKNLHLIYANVKYNDIPDQHRHFVLQPLQLQYLSHNLLNNFQHLQKIRHLSFLVAIMREHGIFNEEQRHKAHQDENKKLWNLGHHNVVDDEEAAHSSSAPHSHTLYFYPNAYHYQPLSTQVNYVADVAWPLVQMIADMIGETEEEVSNENNSYQKEDVDTEAQADDDVNKRVDDENHVRFSSDLDDPHFAPSNVPSLPLSTLSIVSSMFSATVPPPTDQSRDPSPNDGGAPSPTTQQSNNNNDDDDEWIVNEPVVVPVHRMLSISPPSSPSRRISLISFSPGRRTSMSVVSSSVSRGEPSSNSTNKSFSWKEEKSTKNSRAESRINRERRMTKEADAQSSRADKHRPDNSSSPSKSSDAPALPVRGRSQSLFISSQHMRRPTFDFVPLAASSAAQPPPKKHEDDDDDDDDGMSLPSTNRSSTIPSSFGSADHSRYHSMTSYSNINTPSNNINSSKNAQSLSSPRHPTNILSPQHPFISRILQSDEFQSEILRDIDRQRAWKERDRLATEAKKREAEERRLREELDRAQPIFSLTGAPLKPTAAPVFDLASPSIRIRQLFHINLDRQIQQKEKQGQLDNKEEKQQSNKPSTSSQPSRSPSTSPSRVRPHPPSRPSSSPATRPLPSSARIHPTLRSHVVPTSRAGTASARPSTAHTNVTFHSVDVPQFYIPPPNPFPDTHEFPLFHVPPDAHRLISVPLRSQRRHCLHQFCPYRNAIVNSQINPLAQSFGVTPQQYTDELERAMRFHVCRPYVAGPNRLRTQAQFNDTLLSQRAKQQLAMLKRMRGETPPSSSTSVTVATKPDQLSSSNNIVIRQPDQPNFVAGHKTTNYKIKSRPRLKY